MASDVNVVIDLAKPVTGTGFGFPLIFQGKASTAVPYTVCTSINDVATALGNGYANSNIYKAAQLMLAQGTPPAQFAIMASTGTTVASLPAIMYQGWRQLIVVSIGTEGESSAAEIATYILSDGTKMYFTSVTAVGSITVTNNERTVMMVHADTSVPFPEAALVGATAGKVPGSITYKNQVLKGLVPAVLGDSELEAISEANAIAFVLKAGEGVTSDGVATNGEYIDIVDSEDWIVQNIEYQTQLVLINNDKIPYDNNGIAMLENVCVNVLREAANNGMIAIDDNGDYEYSVNYKGRSETSASDRAARRYVEGAFTFALSGAIHTVQINGTITI